SRPSSATSCRNVGKRQLPSVENCVPLLTTISTSTRPRLFSPTSSPSQNIISAGSITSGARAMQPHLRPRQSDKRQLLAQERANSIAKKPGQPRPNTLRQPAALLEVLQTHVADACLGRRIKIVRHLNIVPAPLSLE